MRCMRPFARPDPIITMPGIIVSELPPESLLRQYRRGASYTDCFSVRIDVATPVETYVRAFLTTWLFRLERRILAVAIDRPSTDEQAAELAAGRRESFSGWLVEARTGNQLLLADFQGNTRSWLMVRPDSSGGRDATRLYFGSAVLAQVDPETGKERISPGFRALLGFHKLYSRALLHAAARALTRP